MELSDMIDGIRLATAQQGRAEEGDYIVEGLLYCHKCNTPKQCRVELGGRILTPMCLCKCEAEKRNAEQQRQEYNERVRTLRKAAFPDGQMTNWRFDRDDEQDKELSKVAHNYVEHFEELKERGKGLLLYGGVGTGKTFIAACIANALIDRGYPCLVTTMARLNNTLSGMYDGRQQFIDGLRKYSLLVIDDLAAERCTEYMSEVVHGVIDARYRAGSPLIITTNLTPDELKNPADVRRRRVYSRLFEMCIPVEVEGCDRRKAKLKADWDYFQQILR